MPFPQEDFDEAERYYKSGKFYNFVKRIAPHSNANDIMQESMERFWRYASTAEKKPMMRAEAYLNRIARNLQIDEFRDNNRRKLSGCHMVHAGETEIEGLKPLFAGYIPPPDAERYDKKKYELFKNALRNASHLERTIIRLRYRDGLSYDEIAKALSMKSANQVRMRLTRWKNRHLKEDAAGPDENLPEYKPTIS